MHDASRDDLAASPVLAVATRVAPEGGRWVVWLDVVGIPDRDDHVTTHRMADYPSRDAALVAARWMARGANRALPRPPTGS